MFKNVRRTVFIILAILLAACLCFFAVMQLLTRYVNSSGEEVAIAFLERYQTDLVSFINEADNRWIEPGYEMSAPLKKAFRRDIVYMDGRSESGCVSFKLQGFIEPLEGSSRLIYIPSNTYERPFLNESNWITEVSGEECWRWTGGGINGNGYISAIRLKPCWFYEEIYYPT